MSVKIPQVLTGALGAAVYTCLAQRAGSYLIEAGGTAPDLLHWTAKGPNLFDWGTLLFLLLWNTKNLVDDYKAFEHAADAAFHLLFTVFFSALAYTLLALAASTLFKGLIATEIMVAYFLALALWSFFSWVRRYRSVDRSDAARSKLYRRARWIGLYSICAASIAMSLWLNCPLLFILIVGSVYIYDCHDCGTFSANNPGGI